MLPEPSVDEQRGEAMDDGPCGHGEHHRIAARAPGRPPGNRRWPAPSRSKVRAPASFKAGWAALSGTSEPNIDAQIRGMREGELHVADPERVQALARVGDGGADHHHALGHLHEAPLGHRREKGLAVREVPVRRGLGHVGPPRDLAQAEALRPLLAISAAAASTSVSRRLPAGWVDLRRGDIGLGSSPLGGPLGRRAPR